MEMQKEYERNTQILSGTPNAELDALLAQVLNKMSFKEREALYEEIHGVSTRVEETEELVENCLRAMERELDRIPSKHAYKIAEASAREYVTNRKFRLMFLRSQKFDAKKAASHLVRYMEGKLELFGPAVLGRPVYWSDLDEDDHACLKAGAFQVLPKRDRSGRAIIANFVSLTKEKCYKRLVTQLRSICYVGLTVMEEDEETQKKGIVGIAYNTGGRPVEIDSEYTQLQSRVMQWMPWRIEAVHNCVDDMNHISKQLNNILITQLSAYLQVRYKFHYGTHTECQYSLMTFGIPMDAVPITYNGEVKLANHLKWIERRKVKEAQMKMGVHFDGIDLPGEDDVLSGRGNTFREHPGNVKMRRIVCHFLELYKSAASDDVRVVVAMKVVKDIKSYGGRFLKREKDGWWREVDDIEAEKRVNSAMRTMISSSKEPLPVSGPIVKGEHLKRNKRARVLPVESATGCCSLFRPFS